MKDNLKKKLQGRDMDRHLLHTLHRVLTEESQIEGDSVWLPVEQLRIRPQIDSIKQAGNGMSFVVLDLYLDHPDFEDTFYECVAAAGEGTNDACEQALKGFLLAAMCGVRHFIHHEAEYTLDTDFLGERKHWEVSQSCMAIMGNPEENIAQENWWEVLRDALAAHLGNQKVYTVKVYAAKSWDGSVTGECRVNDISIPALGNLVGKVVEQWQPQSALYSQKQFFFLRQTGEFTPYPYTAKQVRAFTRTAVALYDTCLKNEEAERYQALLQEQIGDQNLAVELNHLLPELFATQHLDWSLPDELLICWPDGRQEKIYATQLASRCWIEGEVYRIMREGAISNDAYGNYVAGSALYNVSRKAEKDSADLRNIQVLELQIQVPQGYQVR